jgi:EAL domain-containing protein (putative c-di-GMP-specific phosphodiesterase class I)
MWRRLARGEAWTGRLTNRRKDGELYEVDATISPIRGPDGEVNGYLGVQRDVTALTAARSALATEFRERAAVSAALSRLQPRGSAEETAAAICDELAGVPGVDVAAIFTFQDPGRGLTLAVTGPEGLPVAPGRPLPAARAAYLYERASQGPWAEAWRTRPEDGADGRQLADLGLKATAFAPIRNGEGLLGLVLAGTSDATFASHLIDHLPIVGEFAATASALLAGQVEQGRRVGVVQARIKAILATGAFHPVFQPVVELVSGRAVGYEALTRFDDGTRPDEVFADAQAAGLGLELEAACLAAAIKASDALSPETWLSLNASPDLILEPITLRMLIEGQSRQIILEITEHVAIADYAALRAALAALGPTVSLSVDDAGAGFASLHHVVELSPRFLKLDISLVRNVDGDPTRQAMIAGLVHFAGRTGCVVIAEGIEEPAELAMLRELGVPLGQGYLLGRPEPLPSEPSAQRPRT